MRVFTRKIKYAIGDPDKPNETLREGSVIVKRYASDAEIEAAIFRANFDFSWYDVKDNHCHDPQRFE